jgi:HTH-type transcriptional regulator / antitoxin HipB
MDDISRVITEAVQTHRKRAGLSRVELAKLAGIGQKAIFELEHGKQTTQLDTLLKILTVLNIKLWLESPFQTTLRRRQP